MLRHNILAVTHRYGATCASIRLLRVAMQQRVVPRDYQSLPAEFSNLRSQPGQATVSIVLSRKRAACKSEQTIPSPLDVPSADKEYPAASPRRPLVVPVGQ